MMDYMRASRAIGLRRGAICGLALLAVLGGCPSHTDDPNKNQPGNVPGDLLVVTADDHVESAGAPSLTVIEYLDFECPVCGRFFRETYPTIKRDYIDTGKVRWVARQYPLRNAHPHAELAAQASECAGQQGLFFGYHDVLFANQTALESSDLKAYADQVGADAAAFAACLDSNATADAVQADVDGGNRIPVTGTPTFLIGDEIVVGFKTAEQFAALLDAALAE
ncbi:MAG: thioredoxin domain-containing protein [Phycisphaerales bacterium]|nr:thioredoxin domain-containing protein [Phycisphaerales bacterium]